MVERLRSLRRPVRVGGLLLALVVFLVVPLSSASCSVPQTLDDRAGTIEVGASGADLVTRSWDLTGEGSFAPGPDSLLDDTERSLERRPPELATQLSATAVVVLLLTGAALACRRPRGVSLVVPGIALASAGGIVVSTFLARDELRDLAALTLAVSAGFPSRQGRAAPDPGEFVDLGAGAWVPLLLLAAVVVLEGTWRRHRPSRGPVESRRSAAEPDDGS